MFTCYSSDLNEDHMATNYATQNNLPSRSNILFKKSSSQIIDQLKSTSNMDVDQTPVDTRLKETNKQFPEYYPPSITKVEQAHEMAKLLKDYPGFEYAKPAFHFVKDQNNKKKTIKIIKAIISNKMKIVTKKSYKTLKNLKMEILQRK
ncbi:hypothetical protein RclHR1_21220006 [Rhizophagus clarus]|uniref:Uncharacterized protein n=1 Tax=Rhizophagus clarus TaxID=94130 RepID=A0A2Z6R874_9GLOM|nr:hypothetical protein RclHR1_21220006 [Rhizophagus clarus]GES98488.1 hypothetical protein RCL_jg28405.t1 [Rhizophagus clarus]